MSRTKFRLILQSAKLIAPYVRHLVFIREDGQQHPFIPGQFVNLHFKHQDKPVQRSYSIASNAPDNATIEIAIAEVKHGKATDLLFQLQPGEGIDCSGPFGRLTLKEQDNNNRYVLVATGTGVVPYRAMLTSLAARFNSHPSLKVTLIFGVREASECLYCEEFLAFAKNYPQFTFIACYSQHPPETLAAYERQGRVLAHFDAIQFDAKEDIVYLCGNPSMVDDAYDYLREKGFDNHTVRREKYVLSKN